MDFEPPVYFQERPRRRWPRILGLVFLALAGLGLAGFITLYIHFTSDLPEPEVIAGQKRERSVIFTDEAGTVFAVRGSAYGDDLTLDQMPPHLVEAFLAAEDRRFYWHLGIDLIGLGRAIFVNLDEGRMVQGGSTITQQLARILFLTNEKTLSRKVEEAFIAFWLEMNFSKDEILALYLNRVYLGAGAYGVDAAARRYFGVSAKDVTLQQAAMLAALTVAPSRLSPRSNIEAAQERAALVLNLMVETDAISAELAAEAKANPAAINEDAAKAADSGEWYADYAYEQLLDMGLDPATDLVVTTPINLALQAEAGQRLEEALAEGEAKGASQGALVSLSPDGALRALIGGRNYRESQFNRAFQAQRQPGSAFKAFVYLAGFEYGLSPLSIKRDAPLEIEGWSPDNYTQDFKGRVTLIDAFKRSLNSVAVRVSEEAGREMVIDVAKRLGITSALRENPSIALGTSEVTLIDMVAAYGAFAANGYKVEPYAILAVRTRDGALLWQRQAVERQRVISDAVLRDMNAMMWATVNDGGTGKAASLGERPAAGKTGTSQSYRDAWFIGFTADYVTGVWVGNDENQPMQKVVGGSIPARVWKAYMEAAERDLPVTALAGAGPIDTVMAGLDGPRSADDVIEDPIITAPDDEDSLLEDLFGGAEEKPRRRPRYRKR
ncbi:MAG TPA: PBP1A family penicillin-binding protein [Micropepsaceae bacterium]|nr:PBP1A family penicillin-binding protein [Micropepsaceae bacterium]